MITPFGFMESVMFKDATVVMMLGMGTVFLVLLALLVLMTLGGKLAQWLMRPKAAAATAGGAVSVPPTTPAVSSGDHAEVAAAVAAIRRRAQRDGKGAV
ncbi:MAG: hypothetical protein GX590_00635 [Lentisphaerae bacterium]|nr:hypothetical protein [Lentisphaerota bacterium]